MSKYRIWLIVAVLVIASLVGMRYLPTRLAMRPIVPVKAELISANTNFAMRLFNDVNASKPEQNILISPCGVSLALSMAYNGAQGDTREAMGKALGLDRMSLLEVNESNANLIANLKNSGVGVRLDIANGLWANPRYPIVPEFVNTARKYYEAEAANLDFVDPASVSIVNKWVRQKTQGRIDNIAEDFDNLTVLCLINAIYFKGNWTYRFEKDKTHDKPFMLANREIKNVPMMCRSGKFRYYRGDSFEAAAFPYGNRRMSMYVFVPGEKSSLKDFLRILNARNWEKWMSSFRETKLQVSMPRWKYECETYLNKTCKRLGMGIAFDSEKSNFRAMCKCNDRDNVYISLLKQKAFVEVNEDGTEASAATLELFHARSAPPEFKADRSFIYIIRDDTTGEILFMGSVFDPTKS